MSQKLTLSRVLPVELPRAAASPVDYIYEQPPARCSSALLPRYVEMEIYRALLGIGGGRTRRAHDRHGCGHLQRGAT